MAILAAVPFELFRVKLKTALENGGLRGGRYRKSAAGRKPRDEVLIFRCCCCRRRTSSSAI